MDKYPPVEDYEFCYKARDKENLRGEIVRASALLSIFVDCTVSEVQYIHKKTGGETLHDFALFYSRQLVVFLSYFYCTLWLRITLQSFIEALSQLFFLAVYENLEVVI